MSRRCPCPAHRREARAVALAALGLALYFMWANAKRAVRAWIARGAPRNGPTAGPSAGGPR